MKGVYFHKEGARKKPFSIRKTIDKKNQTFYFATEQDAVKARDEYRSEREKAKRRNSVNRERNLAIYGNSCALERSVAFELTDLWTKTTNRNAFVLNDGTIGDIIFEREDSRFLIVQLKTTMAKRNKDYRFSDVCGYTGMPVVCVCQTEKIGWVIDGRVLDERGKRHLNMTPDAPLEKKITRTKGSMLDLVNYLAANINEWQSSTEHEARHDFASNSSAKEMAGIDAYKGCFKDSVYEWPREQNGHTDLIIDNRRAQFKTARVQKKQSGLKIHLSTSAGKDKHGKRKRKPYPLDAFDDLIVVYEDDCGQYHFWRIPAIELSKRGFFSTANEPGKISMAIHADGVGRQPDPCAKRKADVWTKFFYRPLFLCEPRYI